jgi:glycosyltransferase involved in cell wall biosynthesis
MSRVVSISIGLPVFNGETYLRDALEATLGQTYGDFELIISDNASTDRSLAICEEYARSDDRIRVIRQPRNCGVNANHQIVFRESKGDFFRWANADDIPSPDLLKHAVETLHQDRALVAYIPDTINLDGSGNPLKHFPRNLNLRSENPVERVQAVLTRNYQMVFDQGLIRRSTLTATTCRWDYFGWDFILLLDLALRGQLANIEGPILQRRMHNDSAAHATRKVSEVREWVDPSIRSKILLPHWKWVWERIRSVLHSQLDSTEKIAIMRLVMRHAWCTRYALKRDVVMAMQLLLGRTDEYPF